MKKLLLLLLVLPLMSNAQSVGQAFVGVAATQSVDKTLYSEANILIGIKYANGDEISTGVSFRDLPQSNIGHKQQYYGGTFNAQSGLLNPVLLNIRADFLYGEWWMGTLKDQNDIKVTKYLHFLATLSVGYAVNDYLDVYAGFNPNIYDPRAYTMNGNRAFAHNSVCISIKYKIPFGEEFSNHRIYNTHRYF